MRFLIKNSISVECVGGVPQVILAKVKELPKQYALKTGCKCIKANYVMLKGSFYIEVRFTPTKIVNKPRDFYMTAKQVDIHYGATKESLIITAKVYKDGHTT